MAKAKKGIYILGQGIDFKPKMVPTNYGYDWSLEPLQWYVVNGKTGAILGHYDSRELAVNLIQHLVKRDEKKLSQEIEKLLTSDE